MSRKSPHLELTENELQGINKSFEALNEALEDLEASVRQNAMDHQAIKIKLDNVLLQLKSLARTVSGDRGLVARVSVLEVKLLAAEEDIEKKAQEIKDELNREISSLKAGLDDIKSAQEECLRQELAEAKGSQKEGRSYRISVWGAAVSTTAVLITLALFSLQNCAPKQAVKLPAEMAE